MASIYSILCCFRQRRLSTASFEDDHENDQLLPNPSEPLPGGGTFAPAAIDRTRLEDRLGTIVRAKEAKMVNVSTALFNPAHNASQLSSVPSVPDSLNDIRYTRDSIPRMTYHRIVTNEVAADDSRESSASRDGSEDVGYGAGLVKKLDLRYANREQSEEHPRGRPRAREASDGGNSEQGQSKDASTSNNNSQSDKTPAVNPPVATTPFTLDSAGAVACSWDD